MNKQIRVSPNSLGGRRVHKPGSEKDSKHTFTKAAATAAAEKTAKREGLETKIQRRDGTISGGNSYGRDPFPPKG